MTMKISDEVLNQPTNGSAPHANGTNGSVPYSNDTEATPAQAPLEIYGVSIPADLKRNDAKTWFRKHIHAFVEFSDLALQSAIADILSNVDLPETWVNDWAKIVKANRPKPVAPAIDENAIKPARPDRRKENIKAGLVDIGHDEFSFNEFSQMIFTGETELDDGACASIRVEMRDKGFMDMNAIEDFYFSTAKQNSFNPVKQYLESLVWDGKDHLADLLSHITFENDPTLGYTENKPEFLTTLEVQSTIDGYSNVKASYALHLRWMFACVARPYNPQAQNFMPVLDGPPGIGKSFYAKFFWPQILRQYCAENIIDPDNREMDRLLATRWLSLEDELDGLTNKKDRSQIKGVITQETATFRIPYAREMKTVNTTVNFYATINAPEEGFLVDPTGNRRFAVMKATAIDKSYSEKIDIDQVWAQVFALWKANPNAWRLTKEESDYINATAATYTKAEIVEDVLAKHFQIDKTQQDYRMTGHEIMVVCKKLGMGGPDRSILTSIGNYLKTKGLSKTTNSPRQYIGVRVDTLTIEALAEVEKRQAELRHQKELTEEAIKMGVIERLPLQ